MSIALDLDGTITKEDVGALPQDWFDDHEYINRFLKKCTLKPGIEVLEEYEIVPIIITGRIESRRQLTIDWLNKHDIKFKALIMCPDNYYLEDGQIKFTWEKYAQLKLMQHRNHDITMAFDDKLCAVETLNQHGILSFLVKDDLREAVEPAINKYGGRYVRKI